MIYSNVINATVNNVVHNIIANKYSFKYHGRKITLIPMNATEILEADLERDERRKSEPFRREWAVSNVSTVSSKSGFVQNEDIALSFVGTNILQHVSKKEDKVIEKEHAIFSGKILLDVLNLSTNDANKVLEPSIDFSSSDDECFIDLCDKQCAMIIPMPQLVKKTDSFFWIKILGLKIRNCFPLPLKKMNSNCCVL